MISRSLERPDRTASHRVEEPVEDAEHGRQTGGNTPSFAPRPNYGHPRARRHDEAFPPSTKRNTLRWIKVAKTEATRSKRIATTAQLAAENRRVPNA